MNSVCNNHSRVQPCYAEEYVILLNNFSRLNRVCGKLDGHTDGLLHMSGTLYPWCVAAFSNGTWNIPTLVNQVLDGRLVQTYVNINALCEQRWSPEQHPEKKSGHMLHLLFHQGSVELRSCISLAWLPLTPRHRQARLLWCPERVD